MKGEYAASAPVTCSEADRGGLPLLGSSQVSARTIAAVLPNDRELRLKGKRESGPSTGPATASKKPDANVARDKAADVTEKVAAQRMRM